MTGTEPGFPEISEISISSEKIFLSCLSLDGRFIVEKNMTFGIVSIKICKQRGRRRQLLVCGAALQMQLCTEQRQASPVPNRFPRWISYRFPLGVCHSLRLRHTGAFVSLMSWDRWSHPQACDVFSGNHFPLPYSPHLHMQGVRRPGAGGS